jgi:hypothetical protein
MNQTWKTWKHKFNIWISECGVMIQIDKHIYFWIWGGTTDQTVHG